jgi:hypothetical protein
MYHHLSSEQLLARSERHQALLKALDPHSQLMGLLRQSGNTHADSEREVSRAVGAKKVKPHARSSRRDETEEEALSRMSDARDQRADNAGCSLSKSLSAGSFERLRTRYQSNPQRLAKSIGNDYQQAAETFAALAEMLNPSSTLAKSTHVEYHEDSFDVRYGLGVAQAVGVKTISTAKSPAVAKPSAAAKPTVATIRKSLGKAASLLKGMGLEVSYDSDSATLTGGDALRVQSLDKSRVFGTVVGGDAVAQPTLTPELIERAATAALAAGQITGAEANTIATYCAMGSICPEPLLKKLRGE